LVLAAGIYYWLNRSENYDAVYLMPAETALFIYSQQPLNSIDQVAGTSAWDYLKKQKKLAGFNNHVLQIDSLVQQNRWLRHFFKNTGVYAGVVPVETGKYEMLYILSPGIKFDFKVLLDNLASADGGKWLITPESNGLYRFTITKTGAFFFVASHRGKIMVSNQKQLVSKSLQAGKTMELGRNLGYVEIRKSLSGQNLFTIFAPSGNFTTWLSTFSKDNAFITFLNEHTRFLAFAASLDKEGNLQLKGRGIVNDKVATQYTGLIKDTRPKGEVSKVLPRQTAMSLNLGSGHISDIYKKLPTLLEAESWTQYQEKERWMQKKFDIDINEHFLSWIGPEISIAQIAVSPRANYTETALIIQANSETHARENLTYILNQIKKNSPVKFESLTYNGFDIHYLSIGGILKLLLGNLISEMDKPYFTQINDFVVFSNHPQTIKHIIDKYTNQQTLAKNPFYYNQLKAVKPGFSPNVYINTPLLLGELRHHLEPAMHQSILNVREYIECFTPLILSWTLQKQRLELELNIPFSPVYASNFSHLSTSGQQPAANENTKSVQYNNPFSFLDSVVVHDLDKKRHEIQYPNGQTKFSFRLKNGKMDGTFTGYHQNGQIRVKGQMENGKAVGKWAFYDISGALTEEKSPKN